MLLLCSEPALVGELTVAVRRSAGGNKRRIQHSTYVNIAAQLAITMHTRESLHSWNTGYIHGPLATFMDHWLHSWTTGYIHGPLATFVAHWLHSWPTGYIHRPLATFMDHWLHSQITGYIDHPPTTPTTHVLVKCPLNGTNNFIRYNHYRPHLQTKLPIMYAVACSYYFDLETKLYHKLYDLRHLAESSGCSRAPWLTRVACTAVISDHREASYHLTF